MKPKRFTFPLVFSRFPFSLFSIQEVPIPGSFPVKTWRISGMVEKNHELATKSVSLAVRAALWLNGERGGVGETARSSVQRILRASVERLLLRAPFGIHHGDHLDSDVLATGMEGEVLGRSRFSPFGGRESVTPGAEMHGFTGNQWDDSTGAHHFLYRNLDSQTGRPLPPAPPFLKFTPAHAHKYGEATTSYVYVGNHAINATDPHGLGLKKQWSRLQGRVLRKPARQKRARGNCAAGVCYERSVAESYLSGGISGKAYDRLSSPSTRQPQIVEVFKGGTVIQRPSELNTISAGDFIVFDRQSSEGMRAAHWMFSLGGGQAVSNNNSMVLTASNMQDLTGNRITLNEFSFDSKTRLFKRTESTHDSEAFRIRVVTPVQVSKNLGL